MKMVIGGLVGGLIGAVIWAGVVYATEYEIGWIAIGVGFLVGMGVRLGADDENEGVVPGVLSIGISAGAIVLAKFLAAYFMVMVSFSTIDNFMAVSDSDMITEYADEIVGKKESAGEKIK